MRSGPARRTLDPVRLVILAVGAVAQVAILVWIRLHVAGPDGGDICRDVVAIRRIVHGQSPYARISQCGTLFNVPHPPAYFLLIGPFALLPIPWAAALWDTLGIVALWVSVALIVRELRLAPSPWALAVMLALILSWAPWLQTLLEAQISPFLLLLLTLAWLAARRGRSGWAGAALGVAAAVRLFPALAVVYFFIRRDWRAVGASVAVFVGMEALATPLVGGIPGVIAYATRESPAATAEWIAHEHNVSLWGFTHQLLIGQRDLNPVVYAPWLASPLTYALLAVLLGALAWQTYRNRRLPFTQDQSTFLAYLPAMLLASPLTWQHYFVILLLPLLVLAACFPWLHRVSKRPTNSASAITSGATDASCLEESVSSGVSSLRERQWRAPTVLIALFVPLTWIPTLVEQTITARPLPAITGPLVFVLPMYLLVGSFVILYRWKQCGGAAIP